MKKFLITFLTFCLVLNPLLAVASSMPEKTTQQNEIEELNDHRDTREDVRPRGGYDHRSR